MPIVDDRLAGYAGLLAPLLAFGGIFAAVATAPWFSWTDNFLSDLGGVPGSGDIWASRGITSILFNAGLLLAGLVALLWAHGMAPHLREGGDAGRLAAAFAYMSAASLSLIGLLPETLGDAHGLVSRVFFFSVTIALFASGLAFRGRSPRWLSRGAFALAFVAFLGLPFYVLRGAYVGKAVSEMFPATAIAIAVFASGWWLLRLNPRRSA
ncbi:MAG: DUF998 domain-containing protein [Euryarchaeota archaeon]|nr:DUF998 domain-containing protein [Euryarchaeota archaeon]